MDERRRTPRAGCRLHCRIRRGRHPLPARIVDISEGGLCLFSPEPLTARSRIEIVIDVPGYQDAVVSGEVWHVRRQRLERTKRTVWAIGLMLEDADTAYHQLLAAAGVAPGAPVPDANEGGGAKREPASPAERGDAGHLEAVENAQSAGARSRDARATPEGADDGAAVQDRLPPQLDRLEPTVFRVRIKARGGPRTRLLTLTADSADEARALAERDLESPWRVIEVRAA